MFREREGGLCRCGRGAGGIIVRFDRGIDKLIRRVGGERIVVGGVGG